MAGRSVRSLSIRHSGSSCSAPYVTIIHRQLLAREDPPAGDEVETIAGAQIGRRRMIEIGGNADKVCPARRNMQNSISRNEQCLDRRRQFAWKLLQLAIGDPYEPRLSIPRHRQKWILAARNIPNREYANAVDAGGLQSTVAMAQHAMEQFGPLHPTAPMRPSGGGILQHHIRRFFPNHDRWRIGIARRECRHDRRIGDTQPLHAVDSQPRVNHSQGV